MQEGYEDVVRLFTVVHGKIMKNNSPELKQERFQFFLRKKKFPTNRLTTEVVQSPSLEIFRTDLTEPSNMV